MAFQFLCKAVRGLTLALEMLFSAPTCLFRWGKQERKLPKIANSALSDHLPLLLFWFLRLLLFLFLLGHPFPATLNRFCICTPAPLTWETLKHFR